MKPGDVIESAGTRYMVVEVSGEMVRLAHPTCGELAEWYPVTLLLAAGWQVVENERGAR